jgi:hypothetical protein
MTLKINQPLFTRDGRKIGNAIIIDKKWAEVPGEYFVIMTDYGNKARLTEKEIKSLFYLRNEKIREMLGFPQDPHKHAVQT